MDWFKNHIKEIIIVLLVLFSLSKCSQSCSRSNELIKQEQIINSKDSVIHIQKDSLDKLNTTLRVYEERVSGLNKSLNIQDEANKRLSESKKNISVKVQK